MKRYDLKQPHPKMNDSSSTYGMRERGGGDYVRYEDYERLEKAYRHLEKSADRETERGDLLLAENQKLRDALDDIYGMADSPQWRNEPLRSVAELIEQALEQSDAT